MENVFECTILVLSRREGMKKFKYTVGKKFTYDVQTTIFVTSSDVHLLVCFSHTEISAIAK
jgi:hypothetical protein